LRLRSGSFWQSDDVAIYVFAEINGIGGLGQVSGRGQRARQNSHQLTHAVVADFGGLIRCRIDTILYV
jgi:hypothetical protein